MSPFWFVIVIMLSTCETTPDVRRWCLRFDLGQQLILFLVFVAWRARQVSDARHGGPSGSDGIQGTSSSNIWSHDNGRQQLLGDAGG